MKYLYLLLAAFILLLSGCSTRKVYPHAVTLHNYKKSIHKNPITLALYEEYKKWHNTPYKYGGTTHSGIDCSALVQRIYKDTFGIHIPRTTKEQIKTGHWVKKSHLKEGDLLYFKTGYNILHTGIYLENGNFIHASKKKGVIISSIYNPYFRSKYLQARRILP
jgi:cell wall-associated NlpC family hydrolase